MNEVYCSLSESLYRNRIFAVLFLIIFFTVGATGMMINSTRSLFQGLFPFALILSFAALVLFSHNVFNFNSFFVIISVTILGFSVEAAGIFTGKIFGSYSYGETLGPKFLDTPLIIGINWALLVFTTYEITGNLKVNVLFRMLSAALMMVFYDFFLEQVAGHLDMWHWKNQAVPLQNYIAWFIVSILFQALIRVSRLQAVFYLALPLFICQAAFIGILTFYLSL
jgi:bisanhydrobacterioruberin hydratase